jgi:hypothetical protein
MQALRPAQQDAVLKILDTALRMQDEGRTRAD